MSTQGCFVTEPSYVQLQCAMAPQCRRILKQYAALKGMTMSEILYRSTKFFIHSQAATDRQVAAILEREGKEIDTAFVEEFGTEIGIETDRTE